MKERLELLIKNYGLTPSKFAESIGVQRSSISHILTGRNKPSYDLILKILDTYNEVNTDWLLKGEGEMTRNSTNSDLFTSVENKPKDTHVNKDESSTTKHIKAEINPKKEIKKITDNNTKDIESIAVLYTDGTFKVYKNS